MLLLPDIYAFIEQYLCFLCAKTMLSLPKTIPTASHQFIYHYHSTTYNFKRIFNICLSPPFFFQIIDSRLTRKMQRVTDLGFCLTICFAVKNKTPSGENEE